MTAFCFGGGMGSEGKNQFSYLKKMTDLRLKKKKKITVGGNKAIFTKSLGKENINQECSI